MTWPRTGYVVAGETVEINLPWRTLTGNLKEGKFIPASGWSLLGGFTKFRAWGELAGTTGEIQVTPAVQVATDPREPAAVTTASTTFDKEGVFDAGPEVAIRTSARRGRRRGEGTTYIRVGWVVASPTGEVVHASAGGMIELGPDDE